MAQPMPWHLASGQSAMANSSSIRGGLNAEQARALYAQLKSNRESKNQMEKERDQAERRYRHVVDEKSELQKEISRKNGVEIASRQTILKLQALTEEYEVRITTLNEAINDYKRLITDQEDLLREATIAVHGTEAISASDSVPVTGSNQSYHSVYPATTTFHFPGGQNEHNTYAPLVPNTTVNHGRHPAQNASTAPHTSIGDSAGASAHAPSGQNIPVPSHANPGHTMGAAQGSSIGPTPSRPSTQLSSETMGQLGPLVLYRPGTPVGMKLSKALVLYQKTVQYERFKFATALDGLLNQVMAFCGNYFQTELDANHLPDSVRDAFAGYLGGPDVQCFLSHPKSRQYLFCRYISQAMTEDALRIDVLRGYGSKTQQCLLRELVRGIGPDTVYQDSEIDPQRSRARLVSGMRRDQALNTWLEGRAALTGRPLLATLRQIVGPANVQAVNNDFRTIWTGAYRLAIDMLAFPSICRFEYPQASPSTFFYPNAMAAVDGVVQNLPFIRNGRPQYAVRFAVTPMLSTTEAHGTLEFYRVEMRAAVVLKKV